MDRCYWDIPVSWDLSSASGIVLDWQCADATPVSQFNVYLRAGGIWHAAALSPGHTGRLHTSRVLKSSLSSEGVSRGWRRVDTVRIAAWRGRSKDTSLTLANVLPLHASVPAAILRGDTTVPSGERGAARRYARNVAEAFADQGILLACIDDIDVSVVGLAAQKLVILPYHPALSAAAIRQLTGFLARGGRIMGFYTLPKDLGEALGMQTGAYNRASKIPGGIGGISFSSRSVPGLPSFMHQNSANFLDMVPRGQGAVAVGWWTGYDGKRTSHCAVVVSRRGAWFGHVYLGEDAVGGPRTLLALAGHLLPEIWRAAALGHLARVTHGISTGTFRDTLAMLGRRAAGNDRALGAFAQSKRRHDVSLQLLRTGRYREAIAMADACRAALTKGIIAMQRAPRREIRAVWCHRGYGIEGWSWEQSAARLSACGINALLVNVADAGGADYPSSILGASPTLRRRGDQLKACLAACRPRGIQVHAWQICFKVGSNPAARKRYAAAGRLQKTFSGQTREWLCPSHPENRRLEADIAVEMLRRYPQLRGIHLDFIRFPGRDSCFCDHCRRGFESFAHTRIRRWPEDVRRDAMLSRRWSEYRRSLITATVREVSAACRRAQPAALLSVAVFSNMLTARDSVAQDWVDWARKGYIQIVCPMDYHADASALRTDVARQMALAKGVPVRVFPGIGLSTARLDPLETMRQINVTRQARTGGFVLFEFNTREAMDILPTLAPAMR